MKNPYTVLGVTQTTSQDDIKAAYRKLAKKHHPDLNPGNKQNEEKFKDITAAYELVGTPEQRAKFDSGEINEQGQAKQPRGQYYSQSQGAGGERYSQSFEGMDDDFLNSIFGSFGGSGARGAGRQGATFSMPGEDQVFSMEVDFKEAVLGAEKQIKLPNGKSLQIKIPAGTKTGQKLRFQGQGAKGMGNAAPGDMYIEIKVRDSEQFQRDGDNILSEVPVSLSEALLGGEIAVPTVDGSVMLKVPAHSNSGTKLRIRGKGVASTKGKRGDHIVELKLRLPDPPDPKLDALIQEWSKGAST